jgi:maleylpyruvate isomerase
VPLQHRDTAATSFGRSVHDASPSTLSRAFLPGKALTGTVDGVTADPLVLLAEVDRATARLLATAADLDGGPSAPSLLPGWSRGHLLTHLARSGDALVNLLTWARTGVVTPAYPSRDKRDADIAAGADRPLDVLVADVRDSSARFADAAAQLPADAWLAELDLPTGPLRAALVVWRRLREIEVHHVDLAATYRPVDWPESFAHRLLHEVCAGLPGVSLTLRPESLGHPLTMGSGGPPEVAGPGYALAAWLAGRSAGEQLRISPDGKLPALPDWT